MVCNALDKPLLAMSDWQLLLEGKQLEKCSETQTLVVAQVKLDFWENYKLFLKMRRERDLLFRLYVSMSGTLESNDNCGSSFILENKHELMP